MSTETEVFLRSFNSDDFDRVGELATILFRRAKRLREVTDREALHIAGEQLRFHIPVRLGIRLHPDDQLDLRIQYTASRCYWRAKVLPGLDCWDFGVEDLV